MALLFHITQATPLRQIVAPGLLTGVRCMRVEDGAGRWLGWWPQQAYTKRLHQRGCEEVDESTIEKPAFSIKHWRFNMFAQQFWQII